jgi:hypothetical protein
MKQDQMTLDEKKAEFVAFCIESYKMKLGGVSGVKVAEYLNDYGAIDFLLENYDLLHTLGRDQILSEIERYLKKRGA